MNTKEYGHHASGFRKVDGGPSRKFMRGLVICAVAFTVCAVWVMTHTGCAHPIGNGLAALMGFGLVPLRLLCLVLSEAGCRITVLRTAWKPAPAKRKENR